MHNCDNNLGQFTVSYVDTGLQLVLLMPTLALVTSVFGAAGIAGASYACGGFVQI